MDTHLPLLLSQGMHSDPIIIDNRLKSLKMHLQKHTTDRCSIGPATGLEEKELLALAANKDHTQTVSTLMEPVILPINAHSQLPQEAVTSSTNFNHKGLP